jgi:hypothetical protein
VIRGARHQAGVPVCATTKKYAESERTMSMTVLLLASAVVAVLFFSTVTGSVPTAAQVASLKPNFALASRLEVLESCGADAAVTCRAAEGSRSAPLRNGEGVSHLSSAHLRRA